MEMVAARARWKCLSLLLLSFFSPFRASAVILGPPVIDLDIPAGGTKEVVLTVINDSEETLSFHLYTTDVAKTKEGELVFPEAGTTKHSCAGDITLEQEDLLLEPMERKDVNAVIEVPFNAEGGRYAMIMCEMASSEQETEEGIVITPRWRIGSVIRITVLGRENKQVTIDEVAYHPASGEKGEKLTVTINNRGNIHVSDGKGYVAVMNGDKRIVERLPLNVEHMIFPESELELTLVPKRRLRQGDYVALATIDFQGRRAFSKEEPITVETNGASEGAEDSESLYFTIEPGVVDLTVPGGGYRTLGIKIKNDEDVSFTINVELTDIFYDTDGNVQSLEVGMTPYSLKGIISVEPAEFILDAERTKYVRLAFSVPKTKTGGVYGKLVFNARSTSDEFILSGEKEVEVALVVSGTAERSAKINNVDIATHGNLIHVDVELTNDGNVFLKPGGEAKISDMKFDEVRKLAFTELAVMPGNRVKMRASCPVLPSGKYKVTITLNYGTEEENLFWSEEIEIK
jgi:hypothetical protein